MGSHAADDGGSKLTRDEAIAELRSFLAEGPSAAPEERRKTTLPPDLMRDLQDFAKSGGSSEAGGGGLPSDLEAQLKAFVKGDSPADGGKSKTPLPAELMADLKDFVGAGGDNGADRVEEAAESSGDLPDDVMAELRKFAGVEDDAGDAAAEAAGGGDLPDDLLAELRQFAETDGDDEAEEEPKAPEIIRPGPAHKMSDDDRKALAAAMDWKKRGGGARVEMRADTPDPDDSKPDEDAPPKPAEADSALAAAFAWTEKKKERAQAASPVDDEPVDVEPMDDEPADDDGPEDVEPVDGPEPDDAAEEAEAPAIEPPGDDEDEDEQAAPKGGLHDDDPFAAFANAFGDEPADAEAPAAAKPKSKETEARKDEDGDEDPFAAFASGKFDALKDEDIEAAEEAKAREADAAADDDRGKEEDETPEEDPFAAKDAPPPPSSGDEGKWESWDFGADDDEFGEEDLSEEARLRREMEQEAAKERVAEFTQLMVKALLRSGYYDPDHPEAQKAKKGLFTQFEYLLKGRHELSFVSMVSRGIQEVFVDGVLEQSFALSKIMLRGMAEMFIPKLCAFFDRKNVMSVTIKVGISQPMFEAFLDIISHPADAEEAEENARYLLEEFKNAGITKEISVVFLDDVVGRGRRLSWRVEMALSRLAKDLSEIPMLKDASAKKLRKLKRQIFEDIVRPLQQAGFVKELLVNLDLIADEFMQSQGLDVYEEFFLNLPEHMVGPLADSITTDIVKYKEELADPETDGEKKSLLKGVIANYSHYIVQLAKRLAREPTPEGNKILRHIVEAELISVAELPEDVQEYIHIAQMIDEFRDDPPLYLDKFVIVDEVPRYREMCWVLDRIKHDLIKEGSAETVRKVFELIQEHRDEQVEAFLGRKAVAKEYFAKLIDEDLIDGLKERYLKAKKDERADITGIFEIMGGRGVAPLLEMLQATGTSDDANRHKIIRGLAQLGEEAAVAVGGILLQPELKWSFVRSLIQLLEKIGGPEHTQVVQQQMSHPHPEVRIAAIGTFAKLQGKLAEGLIEDRLEDEKEEVRIRALRTLGGMGSSSPKVLQYIVDHLDKRDKGGEEPNLDIQVHACKALAEIGNIVLNKGEGDQPDETVETFLLHVLRREQEGLFGVGRTKYQTKPSKVRAEVMLTLADIGTDRALPAIEKMTRTKTSVLGLDIFQKPEDNPVDLQPIARDCLRRLENRLAGKTSTPSMPAAPAAPAEDEPTDETAEKTE